MSRPPPPLPTRLTAFCRTHGAGLGLAVLALCVLVLLHQAWQAQAQAQRQLGRLALAAHRQAVEDLGRHLAAQRAELQAMAAWPELADALERGSTDTAGDPTPDQRLAARLQSRLTSDGGPADTGVALAAIRRLTWFDENGRPAVDVGDTRAAAMPPMAADLQATQRLDWAHGRLVTRAPVVFNGRYAGQLVALSDAAALPAVLQRAAAQAPGADLSLLDSAGHALAPANPGSDASAALVALRHALPVNQALDLPGPAGAAPAGRWVKTGVAGLDAQVAGWWPAPTLLAPAAAGQPDRWSPLGAPGLLATAALALCLVAVLARGQHRLQRRARQLADAEAQARVALARLEQDHQALAADGARCRQALDQQLQQQQVLTAQRQLRDLAWDSLFSVLPDQAFHLGRDGTVLAQWRGGTAVAPGWQVATGQRLQQALPADAALLARESLIRLNAGGARAQTRHRLAGPDGPVDAVAHWLPLGPEQRLLVLQTTPALAQAGALVAGRPGPDITRFCHDIRTPLNAVIGMARIGDRDSAGRAARDQFRRITEAGQNLLAVLDRLLGLDRPPTGPASPEALPADACSTTAPARREDTSAPAGADGAEAPAMPGPRLSGLRVLAAEDNEVNRLVLQSLLEHEGASVAFAEDGQEAVDRVGLDPSGLPDLVLMDVQMPVMDGLQATRLIRQRHPKLPVIGLTAHAMAEERARCLAAGMNEHVTKPVDLEQLVRVLLQQVGARPVPAPASASASIDWPRLVQGLGGRVDLAERLCRTAANSLAPVPARLRAAAARGDAAHLVVLAQELAANLAPLQVGPAHALALRTAQAAADPRLAADLPALAETLATTIEALAADARRQLQAEAA